MKSFIFCIYLALLLATSSVLGESPGRGRSLEPSRGNESQNRLLRAGYGGSTGKGGKGKGGKGSAAGGSYAEQNTMNTGENYTETQSVGKGKGGKGRVGRGKGRFVGKGGSYEQHATMGAAGNYTIAQGKGKGKGKGMGGMRHYGKVGKGGGKGMRMYGKGGKGKMRGNGKGMMGGKGKGGKGKGGKGKGGKGMGGKGMGGKGMMGMRGKKSEQGGEECPRRSPLSMTGDTPCAENGLECTYGTETCCGETFAAVSVSGKKGYFCSGRVSCLTLLASFFFCILVHLYRTRILCVSQHGSVSIAHVWWWNDDARWKYHNGWKYDS